MCFEDDGDILCVVKASHLKTPIQIFLKVRLTFKGSNSQACFDPTTVKLWKGRKGVLDAVLKQEGWKATLGIVFELPVEVNQEFRVPVWRSEIQDPSV